MKSFKFSLNNSFLLMNGSAFLAGLFAASLLSSPSLKESMFSLSLLILFGGMYYIMSKIFLLIHKRDYKKKF